MTFDLWLGERESHLRGLDRALERDGFAALPRSRVAGGLDMDFSFWRIRAGLGVGGGGATTQNPLTGAKISTWLSELGFNLGFDLLRYRSFTLFAGTGYYGGNLFVDGRVAGFTAFAPQLEPWEQSRVNFEHGMVPVELGFEYLVPFARATRNEYWSFVFGFRGVEWFQTAGGWTTDSENGRDARDISGPAVDTSGLLFKPVIDIGLYAVRPRTRRAHSNR